MTGESVNEAEGRCPKRETIKVKGGTEWIHSVDHDIARGTCANNRPLSLDLGVFVQNYTEALCSQTALETALMFIQIPDECRITVTLISSLIPRDKKKGLTRKRELTKSVWNHAESVQMKLDVASCRSIFFFPFGCKRKGKHWRRAALQPSLFCQLPFAWNYYEGDLLQLFIHSIALH